MTCLMLYKETMTATTVLILNTAVFFFIGSIWSKDGGWNMLLKFFFFLLAAGNVIFMTWGMR